jgi:hypothetical protein
MAQKYPVYLIRIIDSEGTPVSPDMSSANQIIVYPTKLWLAR